MEKCIIYKLTVLIVGVRGHVHSLHGLLEWMRSLKVEAVLICTGKVNVRMLSKGNKGKLIWNTGG